MSTLRTDARTRCATFVWRVNLCCGPARGMTYFRWVNLTGREVTEHLTFYSDAGVVLWSNGKTITFFSLGAHNRNGVFSRGPARTRLKKNSPLVRNFRLFLSPNFIHTSVAEGLTISVRYTYRRIATISPRTCVQGFAGNHLPGRFALAAARPPF